MKYPIELELTDHCALQCSCCPNKDFLQKWHIDTDTFYTYIDYIYKNKENISFVDVCWIGDIFLHPKIHEYLYALAEKFTDTELEFLFPTKGNILTDGILCTFDELQKSWFRFGISISMYSLRPEIHDLFAGKKSLHKTFSSIRKLHAKGIPFSLELLLNRFSKNEIEYFYELWKKLWVSCKVHNYHNFSWLIAPNDSFILSEEFINQDQDKQDAYCSSKILEENNFHCRHMLPLFSRNWEIYNCVHGGKQKKFKWMHINEIVRDFPLYMDYLSYIIKHDLDKSKCQKCSYYNPNIWA